MNLLTTEGKNGFFAITDGATALESFLDYRKRTSPQFKGAIKKGWEAFVAGKPLTSCPYSDWRTGRGMVTFSRAFIRYWITGWEAAQYWASNGQHGRLVP